ncbi:MAG TPA: M23 family metallopeptidase [Chloroflexia bacterium]|jgi:hypothetical protein
MPSFTFDKSIPTEASQQIANFVVDNHNISWVAFQPGGGVRFSIVTTQTFFNRNISPECHDQMVAFRNAGQKIVCVAFKPGSQGFSIVTDQTFFNRNIPPECHDQMVAFRNAGQKIVCVAFTPANNGFCIVTDQTFFNRNIPQECHDQMVAYKNAGHKILCVAFTASGAGFSIITNQTFTNRNIPQECHERMSLARSSVGPLRMVAFDPDGDGWVVITAYQPPAYSTDNLLQVTGSGQTTSLELTGLEFDTSAQVKNLTGSTVTIDRAYPMLAASGGWSYDVVGNNAVPTKIGSAGPSIGANANISTGLGHAIFSAPVTHFVYRFQAHSGAKKQDAFAKLPIVGTGHGSPSDFDFDLPVAIALQEPIDVFPLDDGQNQITLLGQLINGSNRPINLKYWHFTIESAGEVIYSEDLSSTFAVINHPAAVIPFLYGLQLPNNFATGRLTIDAIIEIGGKSYAVRRQANLAKNVVGDLLAPIEGKWHFGNGIGQLNWQPHYGDPCQRYAYDIGILKKVGGNITTFDGPANKNESFFCWDKPIFAMASGTVIQVVDNFPDHFGREANPANPNNVNNVVMIRHNDQRISLYFHLRQNSAKVAVGQSITAGTLIGRVGNAGGSSEPHLHFDMRSRDAAGRGRAWPMMFTNLTQAGGGAVQGVPRGSKEFVALAASLMPQQATMQEPGLHEIRVQAGTTKLATDEPGLVRCGLSHGPIIL